MPASGRRRVVPARVVLRFRIPRVPTIKRHAHLDAQSRSSSGGVATNGVIFPQDTTLILPMSATARVMTMMYGECSFITGIQKPWIVGSTSYGDGGYFGWVQNAKNIYHPINSKPFMRDPSSPTWDPVVNLTNVSLGSMHPGGTHVVLCDASVHFLRRISISKASIAHGQSRFGRSVRIPTLEIEGLDELCQSA